MNYIASWVTLQIWMSKTNEQNQKMLRQFKYLERYYPNTKPGTNEYAHLSVHADHCIEMLRQSALCHGDGSLTTFKWSPSASKPMLDLTRPAHTCVNWNSLTASVENRVVKQEEIDRMTNPLFSDGTSEKEIAENE